MGFPEYSALAVAMAYFWLVIYTCDPTFQRIDGPMLVATTVGAGITFWLFVKLICWLIGV